MTFHYITILFHHICLSKGIEILGNWNAAVYGKPLDISLVYSTTMILMMYSPTVQSKVSCELFSELWCKGQGIGSIEFNASFAVA